MTKNGAAQPKKAIQIYRQQGIEGSSEKTLKNRRRSTEEIRSQALKLSNARKWLRTRKKIEAAAKRLELSGKISAVEKIRALLQGLPVEMASALEYLSVKKIDESFELISSFLTYPNAIVRVAAVKALGAF